jgi:hypothetical protein
MTEEGSGMTETPPTGPIPYVHMNATLRDGTRIRVASMPTARRPGGPPAFVIRLGDYPVQVDLDSDRAGLVRLRDAIDAAVAEADETETGDPEM